MDKSNESVHDVSYDVKPFPSSIMPGPYKAGLPRGNTVFHDTDNYPQSRMPTDSTIPAPYA